MYKICTVTNWSDSRDSTRRIAPADVSGSRQILLNPNRFSDIKVRDLTLVTSKSIFKFFDNHLDRREGYSVVKADDPVVSLITAADTAFHSNMITLPIHKNNNPDNATVDHTMNVDCIAYADSYNPDPTNHCWVVYYNAAFKRREVLTSYNIDQIADIAETGSTTTTTTSTTE